MHALGACRVEADGAKTGLLDHAREGTMAWGTRRLTRPGEHALPVRVLSRLFRRLFLTDLEQAYGMARDPSACRICPHPDRAGPPPSKLRGSAHHAR